MAAPEKTMKKILDAARAAEDGSLSDITLSEIAARAGCSLYYQKTRRTYFSTSPTAT